MKKSIILALGVLASFGLVQAQGVGLYQSHDALFEDSAMPSPVAQAVPLLIGLAMLAFFYGLVMFIWKGKEGGETLAKSKQFMIYSLGAIFVMVSIWGIIYLIQSILGVDPTYRPTDIYIPGSRK